MTDYVVVGVGNVGSLMAYELAKNTLQDTDRIFLYDKDERKAEGVRLDLMQINDNVDLFNGVGRLGREVVVIISARFKDDKDLEETVKKIISVIPEEYSDVSFYVISNPVAENVKKIAEICNKSLKCEVVGTDESLNNARLEKIFDREPTLRGWHGSEEPEELRKVAEEYRDRLLKYGPSRFGVVYYAIKQLGEMGWI